MLKEDSNRFMSVNLRKRKPIFKNYIHNNTSILRKEVQTGKLAEHRERLNSQPDRSAPDYKSDALLRSGKNAPVTTLDKLMRQQADIYLPSYGKKPL